MRRPVSDFDDEDNTGDANGSEMCPCRHLVFRRLKLLVEAREKDPREWTKKKKRQTESLNEKYNVKFTLNSQTLNANIER